MSASSHGLAPRTVPRPRLLRIDQTGSSISEHLRVHGDLPTEGAVRLLEQVQAAGLTGRGGARFPVARKLRAVAEGRRTVVVANGCEGEPASSKDMTLLTRSPHLVLDGLALAAQVVRAQRVVLAVHEGPAAQAAYRALRERHDRLPVELITVPAAFLSGEESALVSRLNGTGGLPLTKVPRVTERGVDRRPTLVQNVETLAHLALIARHGASWFRAQGTNEEPGSMLTTSSGNVLSPGVHEVPIGTPLEEVLQRSGGPNQPLRALLVGGYHGSWIPAAALGEVTLSSASLAPWGATPGAGVLVALGEQHCPLAVTARIATYLARQSARQCGPCLNGLPAMAEVLTALAGRRPDDSLLARVDRLQAQLVGRGACHHPDGSVRFVRSALTVFADDLAAHRRGACVGTVVSR